ncbi:NAD(P)-dependent malic enzyme [Atopobium fossor]|uniref:NAD(P)-dependent malic enzyme n=1 Tax=Atopobium fossor TaxID=39487 RepID=UPI0004125BA2|nr:NADP-dependent malic enzyme [Atopobium fossor]
MSVYDESMKLHEELQGKIEVVSRKQVNTKEELSLVYTPGVAAACKAIEKDEELSYTLTRRGHMVAVITDGSAVLGLGNIGPCAGMPVMEGKCALFKEFGDVDAFPLCIDSTNVDEIVQAIALISKSFGGINLEDIAAPRCFEIEKRLKETLDIPVFHDDQHGTAIVVAAALLNACKVSNKSFEHATIVINGCGAAGCAIATLLLKMGIHDLILCDKDGILDPETQQLNPAQLALAQQTNKNNRKGLLKDALVDADGFIGVSRANLVTPQMVATMNDGIVFAMANPSPEILPEDALKGGAKVVGTGRSDYPNQINNVLVFPGIFKGALQARAKEITDEMQIASAYAIASMISDEELTPTNILPSALNKEVADVVAAQVVKAWEATQ